MDQASPPAPDGRALVVVAGPGRSGTSLFAGLMDRLGLYIPQPEVSWNRSNPRGFSEPRWAVEFHRELLKRASVLVDDARPEAWDRLALLADDDEVRTQLSTWLAQQFDHADRVIVKDPRLAWFLALYRRVADDTGLQLKVATLLRDPAEVLKSREIAYGDKLSATARAAGWINVMLTSERLTRGDRRAVVRYEDLLTDWRGTLVRVVRAMDLDLFDRTDDAARAHAGELVDPSLRRSRSTFAELGIAASVGDLTERTHRVFGQLADEAGDERPETLAALDALREEYATLHADAVAVSQSAILAARRDGREEGAARVGRDLAAQQTDRRSLRRRVGRVLRGVKA